MSNFPSSFFTPLGKDYCVYFYFIAIIALITIVVKIINMLYHLFSKKGLDGYVIMSDLIVLITLILSYFVNHLLYSMCVGSLK